jgi:hypothetical protein
MQTVELDYDESLRLELSSYASFNDYEYPTAWLKLTKMDQPFLARLKSVEEISLKLEILMPEEVLISVGALWQ